MRKVRSAPQLAGLEAKGAAVSAAVAGSPRHFLAGAAAGLQGLQKKAKVMVRESSYARVRSPVHHRSDTLVQRVLSQCSCRPVLPKPPLCEVAIDAPPLLGMA